MSSNFINLNRESDEQYQFKDSKNANSSTLSLHIAAYENFVEADTDDSKGGEKEGIKSKSKKAELFKKWSTLKSVFSGSSSKLQNPFEFPRQQNEDQSGDPEVMQFKSSQQILNPNESTSAGAQRIMEEIEIQCEYLRRRENQPDEYDRRKVKCTRRERILQFRNRVAEAFQVQPTSIKLVNRGKLIELNPILSLLDVGIDEHSSVHVLDSTQKAPSMSRRRPQSSASPFLPHSSLELPNVIRMSNGVTLTELSVNRFVMNFVYTEPLCSPGRLDTLIRTLAESFRNKYKVDVDVQRRNGMPYENDVTFDLSFRSPPIMPSGAYNRYEAIKTLLIRQKLFITIAEKYLVEQIQDPRVDSISQNFDEVVLKEMDRVETLELVPNIAYFPEDEVTNEKLLEFVTTFESDVSIDEVPLLGNVLQVRHLVPADYFNILDISVKLNEEASRLTNMQRNLFNDGQTVDSKIADLFTVILRRIHHLQAHIQHMFSEISLRPNDSLRVAYPQGVLSTFSGLNPDLTFTITFMTSVLNRNIPTNETSYGRFTSFHQVHLARPVLRANVAVEVEMGTAHNEEGSGNVRPRPPPRTRMPNAAPYARPQVAFRSAGPINFMNRPPSRPNFVQPLNSTRFVQRLPGQPSVVPMQPAPVVGVSDGQSPRSLREFLSSMQSQQVNIGTSQNGRQVTMNSNDALNPLSSIFRAMDSGGNSNDNNDEEDGSEATAIIIGTNGSSDSNDSDAEDFARALHAAVANQREGFHQVLNNQLINGTGPIPTPSRTITVGPRMGIPMGMGPGMQHHHHPHMHGHGHHHHPGGIPVHLNRLQMQGNNDLAQRQLRNLGPNGGCPVAYYERLVPENLENHATAQEISVAIPDMDLIPTIQRFPFERSVMRRNMNEFVATSIEGLEMILKAYMQGIVSYNSGRQIAHPAIANELVSQGHRIQVRRPHARDRVIEFYRLMGSQDFAFLVNIFKTQTFLNDRGFLGTIVLTFLNSIKFENIAHLLMNPFDLGSVRSAIKTYVRNKFNSDDIDKIVEDVKENLFENYYHYLMGVAPFGLVRDGKNMVGSLQKMDADMLYNFYKLLFGGSSDEEFGTAFLELLRTYHSSLISFCYVASNGFPHAYREFIRYVFLEFRRIPDQQTNFAVDVFMESLVNLALSFDNPENLMNINTENISKYLLPVGDRFTPERNASSLGSFGPTCPPNRVVDIDTTRVPLLPKELLEEDLE
uniref:Ubiquitin-like domain-containing protein n=1 Tax=Panagrolaimus sp. ES5 TaxID=591445 RepID=A0AC34FDU7_9BILA